jgi:hypothetical protein
MTLGLIIANLVLCRRFTDRTFLLIAGFGTVPLAAFIPHLFHTTYFGVTPLFSFILFFIFFGTATFYTWRKFGDETSKYVFFLNVLAVIAVVYLILFY